MTSLCEKKTLISALYDVEVGSETLTRLSRVVAVTGYELQRALYNEELALDKFGTALDLFIAQRVPYEEINMLIELLRLVTSLRQLETYVLHLSAAGHMDYAVDIAFGEEVVAVGLPTSALNKSLRGMVTARIQETIYHTNYSIYIFTRRLYLNKIMLFTVGMFALLFKIMQTKMLAGVREKRIFF